MADGNPIDISNSLGSVVAAIAALGTAAFGLVDATKAWPGGGPSRFGFKYIRDALQGLFKVTIVRGKADDLSRALDTLHGNWINGRPLADQQAIAKSLIKLQLNANTAEMLAAATGVDASILATVGEKMSNGGKLEESESNVLGRFDLRLTALIDDAYQHADQRYRNWSKLFAMGVAVVLALVGGWTMNFDEQGYLLCALAGLLATPLAPISKDLSSALAAAVKVAQTVKR
jgi:hypothetical protein